MEELGLHRAVSITLHHGHYRDAYCARVKSLNLQADLPALSNLIMDGPANFRAMELAARLSKRMGDYSAVYVIGGEDAEVVKIGYASNPNHRLSMLQVGNWMDLRVHALLWVDIAAGGIEALAHEAAREMGWAVRGEWFTATPQEASELILKAARYKKARCYDSAVWLENWSERVEALARAKNLRAFAA